jgi:predicted negative regulator of RcsB-dependent stress response
MKKNIFILITGIIIGITGFIGWQLYNALGVVSQDHVTIVQIVDFLNKNQQQTTPTK